MRYISLPLFSVGAVFLLLTCLLIWQRYDTQKLAFADTKLTVETQNSKNYPNRIIVPDLSIDLPIISRPTTTGVSYLSSSPLPGEVGNSILYGHNWPSLLGSLRKAKVGQVITIKFEDSSARSFKVIKTLEVTPNQSEVLDQTNDARLTIYTCSGFLDSKRFVVVAYPN